MNKKTKKRMLILSFVFLVLWATATWASNDVLKVQSVLGTAIQDIQKIYFSSWAVKNPSHPETEILVNLQNGSVHMWGRMLMAISWANNHMDKLSTWSSLFQGRNNIISWANSFLVWWSWNKIEGDASWSAILWGTSNKIIKGISSYILWGRDNTISGNNSFIIGGGNNIIEWNNSYIFGFTGVKINANNSVAFWKNIEIEKDNVFIWNASANKETAEKENTFVVYAKNWLLIKDATNITVEKNSSTWALNVDWIMQISWEALHCWPAIEGAIQYTWWMYGCFCGCNGTDWVSMTPTQKCRDLCPTIDGFSWDGALCKYTLSDERDSLTKEQACAAWESSDIQEVKSTYVWTDFSEEYVSGWQWTCEDSLWGGSVSCETKRKLVKGRCWDSLKTCQWEWIFDESSVVIKNHKTIWECLPVWYPIYWVANWWDAVTKQICSVCDYGYTPLKDESGEYKKDESDWSVKCYEIEGTSCKNGVTITTDWNVWCTSWGVAKSTVTDAYWNKTWDCESPTWSVWEKFCHTCNTSANYVWSWWTTNKCVLKKRWECGAFSREHESGWCTVWSVEVITNDDNTQSYAWYCKWENAGDEPAFKSDLCTWCPTGKTYNVDSGKCESWTYTVQFDCNWWSNPPANQTFTVGVSQALKANTCTKENYDFKWWSTTEWWSKEYDDWASVELWGTAWETIKLYAVWQAQTYTVQFDCNWWSNPPANQTFTVGVSQALKANTCTKTHSVFQWWSKTSWWSKEYDDWASVDLWGTAWATIILHAVWWDSTDGLCKYWQNGASCIEWTPQIISSNSCEYKWKCVSNNGWNDATCSMSYTPDKTITPSGGGYYWTYKLVRASGDGIFNICGYEGSSLNGQTYNSSDACVAEMNKHFKQLNSPHALCDGPSPYCVPCMHCEAVQDSRVSTPGTPQVEKWSCVVDSVSYPSDDWRCSWIAPSCPATTPSCVTVCHQYKKELTNQYGCSVSSSALGTTTYGDSDSCWAAAKAKKFGAVRSQSYWIGSTSWNKWDSCDIDTDPYCVPCVSCSCMPWATTTVCK